MTKITLTVATPEALRTEATQLAVCLGWMEGWSPDEWEQTFTAQYQDADGSLYRVMSCNVSDTFVAAATTMGPATRPPEDVEPYRVDLAAAHAAQNAIVIWQPSQPDPDTGVMPDNPVPQVSPLQIVAVVGMKGVDALTAMGLQQIEVTL